MDIEKIEKAKVGEILISLLEGPKTFTKIRKDTGTPISTLSTRAAELRNIKLINDNMEKGLRILSLTEKGKKVAEKLLEIENIIRSND